MKTLYNCLIRCRFTFCIICLVWPGFTVAEALVDTAIHLGSRPKDDLDEFVKQVNLSFDQPVMLHRVFGPSDVPEGHHDPLYWAIFFTSSVDGHKLWGECNRIGPESVPLIPESRSRQLDSPKSFGELLNKKQTLQGSWADVTPVFSDSAKARLDCSFKSSQPIDKRAAMDALRKHFSDVQEKGGSPDLFGPNFYLLEAGISDQRSKHKVYRVKISSIDVTGPEIKVTAWFVAPDNHEHHDNN